MTPRVSVVLPCYNHEAFVAEALRSVFAQQVDDLELVVVDDGSNDGTREVIQSVLPEAGGVQVVFEAQANAGSHAAIARGIELSSGRVIALLNSDDYFAPTRLKQVLPHCPESGDFLLFTGLSMVDPQGRPVPARDDLARWYQLALRQSVQCPTVGHALLCNNIAVTSGNLVFSRGLLERAGGFGAYRFCPDWEFVLRATRFVEPIFVPEVLHHYRLHESNTIDSAGAHAVDEEYGRFVGEYLRACRDAAPANELAPCPAHWPWYFPYFVRTRRRFDSGLLNDLIGDEALTAWPAAQPGAWNPWRRGVVELHERDDLGLLAGAAAGSQVSARESQALLRELALVRLGLHHRHAEFAPPGITDLELLRDWRDSTRGQA